MPVSPLASLATVAITADGIDTAGATFTVAINTMTTAVDETFRVDGEDITLVLPAAVTGPYVRVEATDVNISIGGQALRGDFAFEKTSLFDGTDAVLLAVANVELVLGDAGTASLSLTNGEGALLVLPTGVAGSFAADLAVAIPDVHYPRQRQGRTQPDRRRSPPNLPGRHR